MSPTITGLSVALRTYRQPSKDKQALNVLRHIPKWASMLSNFGGRGLVKLGRDKECCDMPDWAPSPDVGIVLDDVEFLAAALFSSPLRPPFPPQLAAPPSRHVTSAPPPSFVGRLSHLSALVARSLSLFALSLSLCSLSLSADTLASMF